MIRKIAVLLFLALSPLWLTANNNTTTQTSTEQTQYAYANIYRLTFGVDAFTIHFKNGTKEEFTFTNVDALLKKANMQSEAITAIGMLGNPINNMLDVSCTIAGESVVNIINLEGKVMSAVPYSFDGVSTQKVDVSDITSGVYLLQVSNSTQQETQIFMVK